MIHNYDDSYDQGCPDYLMPGEANSENFQNSRGG
jgi:hypothetical protein